MENLIKELEAAKASDNKYLDDSNEPAEPTEVRQIKFYSFSIYNSFNNRDLINVNCVVIQHMKRRT
jgi:hypothetical protein